MAVPLIMAGLSLLPKIPAMWNAVAGMFGKKVPKGVEEAGSLAGEVMDAFKKGQLSPESQIKLKELMMEHEGEMARLAFEEKKLDFEEKKLIHEDLNDIRDLEKESYKSEDQYVRRTRPKILRDLFTGCIAYAFYAPLCVIAITAWSAAFPLTITASTVALVVGMIKWIGGWLFGTFSTAYIGYAAARTVDKKKPEFKNGNNMLNKAAKFMLEGGIKRR